MTNRNKNNLTKKERSVLKKVEKWVVARFAESKAPRSHNWEHVKRVVDNAILISRAEGGDEFLITLTALLHDIGRIPEFRGGNYRGKPVKFYGGHARLSVLEANKTILKELFESGDLTIEQWRKIAFAIAKHSEYITDPKRRTKILEIIQDADRLDAFGVNGIARGLHYAKESGLPITETELPFNFLDSDYGKLKEDNVKSVLSYLWYCYKQKDGLTTEAARRKVKPGAKIYRDFIELLKNSIIKKEGRDYDFWLGFLEYAQKQNLERLNEADLENFKHTRKD